jgi:hypothetical protein
MPVSAHVELQPPAHGLSQYLDRIVSGQLRDLTITTKNVTNPALSTVIIVSI